MKNIFFLLFLSLVLISCSGKKTVDDVSKNSEVIELSSGEDELLELGGETVEEVGAVEINGKNQQIDLDGDLNVAGVNNPGYEVETDQVLIDPAQAERMAQGKKVEDYNYNSGNYPVSNVTTNGGAVREYRVEENETLMMIAFKLYGNYSMWKDLARLNRDRISNPQKISRGTRIRYEEPNRAFSWNPRGEPYLIKTGDTLYKISDKVYNTGRKWRYIWNNNRPLIKNPNLIFAGFTLYYLLNDGRDVANL